MNISGIGNSRGGDSGASLDRSALIGSGYDDWCADCGVNPVYDIGGRCTLCRAEYEAWFSEEEDDLDY